jgi:hypothetical protein
LQCLAEVTVVCPLGTEIPSFPLLIGSLFQVISSEIYVEIAIEFEHSTRILDPTTANFRPFWALVQGVQLCSNSRSKDAIRTQSTYHNLLLGFLEHSASGVGGASGASGAAVFAVFTIFAAISVFTVFSVFTV